MSKNVVIISSSPRINGNSDTLAREFARGVEDGGNKASVIEIKDIGMEFCKGCLYCQSHERCIIDDGINKILDTVQNADVLVFATPVYYYCVSGQLKTFLDRLNPLYVRENTFKDVYLIATCADDDISAFDGTRKCVQGWIDCFEGVKLAGSVLCGNVTDVGDVRNTDAPKRAYELGRKI